MLSRGTAARLVRGVLVPALVLFLLIPMGASSAATRGRTPTLGAGALGGLVPGDLGRGSFVVLCGFSHANRDDMIVFPGESGRSHDHTYFGNSSTNASSTVASLQASASTCTARGDHAAYWVPSLAVDGKPVQPVGAAVYYVRRTTGPVQAFPIGLRMIAGDSNARAGQSLDVTAWSCGPFSAATANVPSCRLPALFLRVRFPDCWDGTHLDAADHKGHMAYSSAGACPASHPVAVPGLQLDVLYPTTGGTHSELASGGQYSSHADFVNAWDQQLLTQRVDQALNHTPSPAPGLI